MPRPLRAAALVAVALACVAGSAHADRVAGGSGGGASAASTGVMVERGDRGETVRRIQAALGIAADGVFGPQTERAVKRFQRRKRLVPDGVVGPLTRAALGLRPSGSRSARREASDVRVPLALRRIAECESGGNPKAISAGGLYRGKYQFSRSTWKAMGGTGDPAAAPESEQDRIALKLYRRAGASPWPSCAGA